MAILISEDGVGKRTYNLPVNDGEARILIAQHHESLVLGRLNTVHGWTNFEEGLFDLVKGSGRFGLHRGVQWVLIDAVVWQERDLVRDLIDKHQTRDVVRMDSSSFCSKEQAIITGSDVSEEDSLLADCANEITFAIEN